MKLYINMYIFVWGGLFTHRALVRYALLCPSYTDSPKKMTAFNNAPSFGDKAVRPSFQHGRAPIKASLRLA